MCIRDSPWPAWLSVRLINIHHRNKLMYCCCCSCSCCRCAKWQHQTSGASYDSTLPLKKKLESQITIFQISEKNMPIGTLKTQTTTRRRTTTEGESSFSQRTASNNGRTIVIFSAYCIKQWYESRHFLSVLHQITEGESSFFSAYCIKQQQESLIFSAYYINFRSSPRKEKPLQTNS